MSAISSNSDRRSGSARAPTLMTIKLLPCSTIFLLNRLTASCEADSTIISVSLKEDEAMNFEKSVNVPRITKSEFRSQ